MSEDKKISELDLVASNASGDVFPLVQGGTNYRTTLSKVATFLQGFLPASVTAKGFVELATNAETQAGTDADRAVTPAGLESKTATETRKGIAELATQSEVNTGTDDERIVTALKFINASKWDTKITKANASNTATGTDEVTINQLSGVARFTQIVNHNNTAIFTINNSLATVTSMFLFSMDYSGLGFPLILHHTTYNGKVEVHVGNLNIDGGTDNTNNDIFINFIIIN